MDKDQRAAWGPAIRDARRQAGMSQDDLAAAAGTTRRTIGSIERGASAPQPGTLKRIRAVLGLESDDVLDDEVQTYLALIGPLLQQLPPERRGPVIREMVVFLSRALTAADVPPSQGSTPLGIAPTVNRDD